MYSVIEVDPDAAVATEQLGSKSKYWFERDGGLWLFKAEERGIGDDWAEKICSELAAALDIPHVTYELAIEKRTGRPGVVCETCVPQGSSLVLGNALLEIEERSGSSPVRRRADSAHTLGAVADAIRGMSLPARRWWMRAPDVTSALDVYAGYLMFDARVANQDRHQENWGAIARNGSVELAPSFDHGAALARNITDEERTARVQAGRDVRRGMPHFARRARSAIFRDSADAKPLSTVAAFREFAALTPRGADVWIDRLRTLDRALVQNAIEWFQPRECAE